MGKQKNGLLDEEDISMSIESTAVAGRRRLKARVKASFFGGEVTSDGFATPSWVSTDSTPVSDGKRSQYQLPKRFY